jgi:hypothetical protein
VAGVAGCCPDAQSIYSHPALVQLVVPLLLLGLRNPLSPSQKLGLFFALSFFKKFLKNFLGGLNLIKGVVSKFLQTAGCGWGTVLYYAAVSRSKKGLSGYGGVEKVAFLPRK